MTLTENLIKALDTSLTAFHAVAHAKELLLSRGYTELAEGEVWNIARGGKYFTVRDGSALLAFSVGEEKGGFRIVASHADSPALKVKGNPVSYTGMTWSGFRPSDDACTYGYLVPANMFAVVILRQMAEMARHAWQDEALAAEALLRWAFPDADLSQMTKSPSGKPQLPGLEFNLSHSGPWVALAVGEGPVGVDVECFRPDLPVEKISARYFTPEERRLADTPEGFLRIWTAKESHIKRSGKGLAGLSDACDLDACRTWLLPGAVLTVCGDGLPTTWEPVTLSQLLREN